MHDFPLESIDDARELLPDSDFEEACRIVRQAALAGEVVSVRAETIEYPDGAEEVRLINVSVMEEDEYIRYRQNGGIWSYVDAQAWLDFEPEHVDREHATELLAEVIEENVAKRMEASEVSDGDWGLRREDVIDVAEAALDGDLSGAKKIGSNRSIPAPDSEAIRAVCAETPRTMKKSPVIETRDTEIVHRFAGIERTISDDDLEFAGQSIGLDPKRNSKQMLIDAIRFQEARTFGWGLTRDEFVIDYAAEILRQWHDAIVSVPTDELQAPSNFEEVLAALVLHPPKHPTYPYEAAVLFPEAEGVPASLISEAHKSQNTEQYLDQVRHEILRSEPDDRLPGPSTEHRAFLTWLWRSFSERVRQVDRNISLDESRVFKRFLEIQGRKPLLFVLGADDPEMVAIRDMLDRLGIPSVTAVDASGTPVRPSNAYSAVPVYIHDSRIRPVVVENSAPVLWNDLKHDRRFEITRFIIDHHRPGDFGYGKGPKEYWEASSIGQVWDFLQRHGYRPERAMSEFYARVVAAADHCPAAAYQGQCPGVSPQRLERFRVQTRAAFQGISESDYRIKVFDAIDHLRRAETVTIAGHPVALLHKTVPELPEAALREGRAFIAPVPDRGSQKWVLQAAPKAVVEYFLKDPSLDGRLFDPKKVRVSPYGDPARGFAGVILPKGASVSSSHRGKPRMG